MNIKKAHDDYYYKLLQAYASNITHVPVEYPPNIYALIYIHISSSSFNFFFFFFVLVPSLPALCTNDQKNKLQDLLKKQRKKYKYKNI